MNMTEVALFVVFVLMIFGSIGWYIYGWFRTPPPPPPITPIPPEQIPSLLKEQEALLKEERVFGERNYVLFSAVCMIVTALAFDRIPKDPVKDKNQPISEERLKEHFKVGMAFLAIYCTGIYCINKQARNAVRAALGDDARPSMKREARIKRLVKIAEQLKDAAAQTPQSNSRS